MKNLLHVLKWSVIGFAALLVVVILALVFYSRTENFERWAREQAIAAINSSIRGEISVDRLSGSVWHKLTLVEVALRYEGSDIVKIPRLDLSFSLWPLIWGEIRLARVEAQRPQAHLRQDKENRWNIVDALSPRELDPKEPSSFSLLVDSLHLESGDIEVSTAAGDGAPKVYHLRSLNLDGRVGAVPTRTAVEVREITAGLISKGLPELRLKGTLDYRQSADPAGLLKIENLWLVSRNSRVKLSGDIHHGETTKIKAQASLDKLAAADIDSFVAGWPLREDLTGNLAVQGPLEELNGELQVAAAGARVRGKFQADVARDQPRYSASASLSGVDLRRWTGNKEVSGLATGTIEARGDGFSLQNIAGKAHLEVHSATAGGWTLGAVFLDGVLQKGVAAVEGRMQTKEGAANVSGKIALGDKRSSYDLALAAKDLNIQSASPNGSGPRGKVNLQGTVKGSGFNLAALNARAEIQILPSTLDQVQIRKGALIIAASERTLRISRASLDTAESSLAINGDIGLDSKIAGRLDYRLRVGDLSPWLKLIKRQGAGAVDIVGQARGNLADLQTEGTARLAKMRVEGIAVGDGNLKFALRGSQERFFPQGVVAVRFNQVEAGMAMKQVSATAKLLGDPAKSIQLDLSVQDNLDRKHTLNGNFGFSGDDISLRLDHLALASPDGSWKLARPATLTKRGDAFAIDQLSLINGNRELSLSGRAALAGAQDVNLKVDRLPLETIMAFSSWRGEPKLSGLLNLQARISGSAAAPEITAAARLDDAQIADQAYRGAQAELNYKNRSAAVRLSVQQDETHSLKGDGAVPLDLSWHGRWRAEFADGMVLRVQSDGLSLAFLNGFGGKSIENIDGELSLDILARGSVNKPDLRGTFGLRNGRMKVVPAGVDIHQIIAGGTLDSRNLNLREFSARAKDGEIQGSGALAIKDYGVDAVKLSLSAVRWPAIETARHQLKIAGRIDVEGTLAAPKVKGQVSVTEGTLRPDLAFLEQSKVPFKRDETIVVVGKNGAPPPGPRQNGKSNENALLKNISVDVVLSAARNVWIRHSDFVSELSGKVQVTKRPEHEVDVTGRIDVIRGWYVLQGRRFELTRGTIQFTGGDKINPALDVVALYRLPQYQVEATIGGTVDKPTLTLASQPRLEQADILALLIFGKPINALSRNEQGSLQQSALGITSGYVASRIASSVSAALGLDHLGVDIGEVDFSGGKLGFSRYVGGKTYVTASQELTGEHGRQVGLEYQIAPDWKVGTTTSSTGSSGIDIIWHKRY